MLPHCFQCNYQIADFHQKLSAEVNEISDEIDRQFPDTEIEFIDYSKLENSEPKEGKSRMQA